MSELTAEGLKELYNRFHNDSFTNWPAIVQAIRELPTTQTANQQAARKLMESFETCETCGFHCADRELDKIEAALAAAPATQTIPQQAAPKWGTEEPVALGVCLSCNKVVLNSKATWAKPFGSFCECRSNKAKPSATQVRGEGKVTLIEAIRKLYYAAVWHADRPVDEIKLWTDVRDAAGFEPGNSPTPATVTQDGHPMCGCDENRCYGPITGYRCRCEQDSYADGRGGAA